MKRVLPLAGMLVLAVLLFLMPNWSWEDGRFDSIIDGAIAVAIFVTTALLIFTWRREDGFVPIVVLAMLVAGIMRFLASTLDTENETVWVDRLCSLALGGALLFDSLRLTAWTKQLLTWFLLSATFFFAMLASFYPTSIPIATESHYTTTLSTLISQVAAACFYISACFRWRDDKPESYPLYITCLFLGLPSLFYHYFPVWSSQWWTFQTIELATNAYLAFFFLSLNFRRQQETEARLRDHAQVMERTLALVSHDIRNPLNTAVTASHLLLEQCKDPEQQRDVLQRMLRNLEQIDNMIQSLLDTITGTRDSGSPPMHFRHCDLAEEFRKMVSAIDGDWLHVSSCDSLWGNWAINEIQRALANLITNARKYGWQNSPIHVRLEHGNEFALLSVHNEGPEIPLSDRARLFKPFQRMSHSGIKGWGLGLAMVKSVAEAHHGTVTLESSPQEGTTFTLKMPLNFRDSSP